MWQCQSSKRHIDYSDYFIHINMRSACSKELYFYISAEFVKRIIPRYSFHRLLSHKFLHGGRGAGGNSFAFQDRQDGAEEDAQIHAEGDILRIPDIHFKAFFPGESITAMRLRIAGQARSDIVPMVLLFIVTWKISNQQRSRSDDAHVTNQDIEEFWKFIQRSATKELPVGDEALFVGQRLAVGIGLAGHGAELDEAEDLLVPARSFLGEERIAFHENRAQDGQEKQQGRKNDNGAKCHQEVQRSFEETGVEQN